MVAKKSSRPVLRMFLDLSVPVDLEVYRILRNFKSAVECKNFLLSAVLYYARSPLVLSANALVDALSQVKIQEHVDQIMGRLEEISGLIKAGVRPVILEPAFDSSIISENDECEPIGLDGGKKSTLLSLKQQFKV
jgi:hypothetical protein